MKKLSSKPKTTAILGLIGSIIMLISIFLGYMRYILNDIYIIGLLIYFIIICTRLYKNSGNIKFANYILIITYSISTIICLINDIPYIFRTLTNFNMYVEATSYLYTILLSILLPISQVLLVCFNLIYLCKILLHKPIKLLNNKILYVIAICYLIKIIAIVVIYGFVNVFTVSFTVEFLGYLLVIPYLYGYYELLKGGAKNGK